MQHEPDQRPLPRSTSKTVYRVGYARDDGPSHVYSVKRIKIGASYDGQPVWSEYPRFRGIGCGAALTRAAGTAGVAPGLVSCAKCRRAYEAHSEEK